MLTVENLVGQSCSIRDQRCLKSYCAICVAQNRAAHNAALPAFIRKQAAKFGNEFW